MEKINRWTLLERCQDDSRYFIAVCDCGTTKRILRSNVVTQKSKSCGCLKQALHKKRLTKHGESKTRYYYVWWAMCDRCETESATFYSDYGGRGIRVCGQMRAYLGFREVMGPRPPNSEIDRINNNGHYSCGECEDCLEQGWPLNVRWATRAENIRNRRCTHLWEYDGKSLTLSEWCKVTGMTKPCLRSRLYNYRWPIAKALTTPVRQR